MNLTNRFTTLFCLVVLLGPPISAARASLLDGLVGYWPLDDLNADDASGNGLDGVVVGVIDETDDRLGNPNGAMLFAGFAEDHVDLGDEVAFQITGAMSISAWVILDSGNVNNGRIISKSGAGGNRSWSLNIESGNSDPTFQIAVNGDTNISVSDVDPLPQDEWVHMTGVYRPGDRTEIYVNGALKEFWDVDIPDEQFSDNGLPVWIGARNQCSNCGWVGSIDDVALWNRPLSELEVTSLFQDGIGGQLPGDFNGNGALDSIDIDDLTGQVAGGLHPAAYDLNQDAQVTDADLSVWVKDLFHSWIGDANLDGEFNSGDLVTVLSSGTYEADVDSVWSTGDFTGDGRTNSGDLVAALSDGGYEMGPRVPVAAVPEPTSMILMLLGVGAMWRSRAHPGAPRRTPGVSYR
jgi:hypothetical protein